MAAEERQDQESRSRIEDLIAAYSKGYKIMRLQTLLLISFAAFCVYLFDQNGDRIEDVTQLTEKVQDQTNTIQRQANQIQNSRKASVRQACEDQNDRNKVARLFLRGLPRDSSQKQLTRKDREDLLIGFTDALVGPVRNCDKRVKEVVG